MSMKKSTEVFCLSVHHDFGIECRETLFRNIETTFFSESLDPRDQIPMKRSRNSPKSVKLSIKSMIEEIKQVKMFHLRSVITTTNRTF